MMVVVPVAVVGGLVGGVAGAAVQAATSDPLGRTASARGTIEQAIADMRLTNGLAYRTSEQLKLPLAKAGNIQDGTILEVGVSELEILALIANGKTSRVIARKLAITVRTVETHRANMMAKLDLDNLAALVRYAVEHGFTRDS